MAELVRADATEKGSPGWWLEQLGKALYAKQDRLNRLDAYYRGDPPLPISAPSARKAYQLFQRQARVNFAEMVVEAPRQRMIPLGFRTGADGDENGDREARRLWDANDLDVESVDVHQKMLSLGVGYVIVGRDRDTGEVVITAEDPRQVITVHHPAVRRRVRAGLKVFRDDVEGRDLAYLYLPGQVWVAWRDSRQNQQLMEMGFRASEWIWAPELSGPLGEGFADVVPVVRFLSHRDGTGEFETHLDHLDRINTTILQQTVIILMQAFRQRAIKGDLPTHDAAGNPINYEELFAAGPDALWQLPPDSELWESAAVDLTPVLSTIKDEALRLAAVTFTPMHLFSPDAASGSAEGASLMREGLVFKTEDRLARASIGWRQVMSLAFRFAGDAQRADLTALQPIWTPPERRSLAERADAASKLAGVMPFRSLMTEVMQFRPDVVDRMEAERASDAFLQAALQAAQAPAGGGQQGQGGQERGQREQRDRGREPVRQGG